MQITMSFQLKKTVLSSDFVHNSLYMKLNKTPLPKRNLVLSKGFKQCRNLITLDLKAQVEQSFLEFLDSQMYKSRKLLHPIISAKTPRVVNWLSGYQRNLIILQLSKMMCQLKAHQSIKIQSKAIVCERGDISFFWYFFTFSKCPYQDYSNVFRGIA